MCAPTPAREPLLTTGRVDLVISTFTYTEARDTRIDFSRAYYKATGRLLVKNESTTTLASLAGQEGGDDERLDLRHVAEDVLQNTEAIVTDSFTNALLAFNQGRADALMWDDTVARRRRRRPEPAKLTNDLFLEPPYGIGISQGNVSRSAGSIPGSGCWQSDPFYDHAEQRGTSARHGF